MIFDKTPNYHVVYFFSNNYNIKNSKYKKLDSSKNWYMLSYDFKEHGNDNFLNIKLLSRYNEAIKFQENIKCK